MEIAGKIVKIGSTQQVSDRFKKRELVVEYAKNPEYPEYVPIEFVQDRVDKLDEFKVGQNVTVNIEVGGRKWVSPAGETKYFVSVKGWRITLDGGQATMPPVEPTQAELVGVDEVPF
jgi:hypothetical protein